MSTPTQKYTGSCHCGDVRFYFQAAPPERLVRCNCSMCGRSGHLHWFIPHADFTLLSDSSLLSEYRFNTGEAQHLFCRRCGIKAYYQPRSHPGCWSVNARCVDDLDLDRIRIDDFNGRNWRASRQSLDN